MVVKEMPRRDSKYSALPFPSCSASVGPGPRPTEGEQVAPVIRLQERVAAMMRSGAPLDQVESEVIDPSELSEDQKAALWLYAWSFMEGKEQRDSATRYLLNVGPG